MPSGKAAAIREAVAKENRADLQLERTPWGKTGFVNVVEVKGKYQARLQVPGDGRGGSVKRKQHPLPGLFDTAEEAAVWLAVVKRDMKAHHNGKLFAPPKIDKPHKPRAKPRGSARNGITGAFAAASVANGHCSGRAHAASDGPFAVCSRLADPNAAAW